jgi:hypothetical protein
MKTIALFLSALILSACGGGGGGGAPAPVAPVTPVASSSTFQLQQAYANYFSDTKTEPFTISGSVAGATVTGSGVTTKTSVTNGTFEGVASVQKTATTTGTMTVTVGATSTTQAIPTTNVTGFASPAFLPLGFSSSTSYMVYLNSAIPATARVGDSGEIASFITYTNSSKAVPTSIGNVRYSVEPDNASTALLKLITTNIGNGGVVLSVATELYRMTPTGALTHLSDLGTVGTATSGVIFTY